MKGDYQELNNREKEILSSIINLYILKANPIGSRPLSKYLEGKLNLSPATIRNVMSDLEEMNYIAHPHTSAGRVPTDKGYRFYVDNLINYENIIENDNKQITQSLSTQSITSQCFEIENWQDKLIDNLQTLENYKNEGEIILKEASKILGFVSKFLALVTFPEIDYLIIQKIELIHLASNKLLVVIALDSNIVKTVTLENNYEINIKHIEKVKTYINDRVQGRTLKFVKMNFAEMITDLDSETTPLIRLFIESIDKLYSKINEDDKIITNGTQNLLEYPEFENTEKVKSVIELIENDKIIVHILDNIAENSSIQGHIGSGTKVLIGSEMNNNLLEDYSIVLSPYNIGNASGSIGVIGPKRMNYQKIITIIDSVSKYISHS